MRHDQAIDTAATIVTAATETLKKSMGILLALVFAGVALLALIYLQQQRLLYFPARTTVEAMTQDRLGAWPSAQDFRGLVAEPTGSVRGTAIVFHGNAGHAGQRAFYADALVPLGWRVILAEYPGYGPREGVPGEARLVADAAQTLVLARRQYSEPLVLIGESLGAAVAAAAAAQQRQSTAGMLLITPWDRLAHVAAHHYPWLPVTRLLRDGYDTQARLAAFDSPVVVAVAEHDDIVPARFGAALHASLRGPKSLVTIAAAGHNDWPAFVDGAWWRTVMASTLAPAP